ncbi:hypothetical protein [Brevibacillus migulae]|uniref:hypothetical protein n=1 Tax=Brevibacillus migulae TaxID=1644114 RepID=UPI00106EA0F7|nr:hypothetical protein [Brevibacillus migulae]
MRLIRYWPFGMLIVFLFIGFLFLPAISSITGPAITSSSVLLHEQMDTFYPLGVTERIKYSYPNRPFDTDLTIEGIGWQGGQAFLLCSARVRTQENTYSHMPKHFSPRVTYKGKTVLFSKTLWSEGASGNFNGSLYRYAVAADDPVFLPINTLPDAIQVSEAKYPLPSSLPAARLLPALPLLEATIGSVEKQISSDDLTYQVTGLEINEHTREITLLVTSEIGGDETSFFLLQDDKGRMYSFEHDSLPLHYESGENEVRLKIAEPLPGDISHLKLVLFEGEFQQSALYNVSSQASIQIF